MTSAVTCLAGPGGAACRPDAASAGTSGAGDGCADSAGADSCPSPMPVMKSRKAS